jgi:hypothetical protein
MLTNIDIEERFERTADGVIRWRKVEARGLPRWAQEKARELNRKAGQEVNFFRHQNGTMIVKLYGGTVAESRVRKVLERMTVQDVAVKRAESARKRAKREAVAVAATAAKPQGYQMSDLQVARKRHIRMALGFGQQPTGLWRHPDGRTWHDSMLMGPAALAAGEEFDAMQEGLGHVDD